MRICPRCHAAYPDDARFCPEDGTQLVVPGDGEDPHIGKVLLGQFEVREICGRGSMGTVYRAWQDSMERDVAVKVLRRDLLRDEKVVKRFHREARAAARLSHPNIITVYLVGDTDDGLPFIVMEYVTGSSLDETCSEAGPMPVVRAVHIARQIAAALTEAHTHNIVHRDLKPENILLSSKKNAPDFVKVLDFGIAKILYANDEPLTQTGAIFGTPHYLAPEQASGSEIDHRCDLYALGVILFRMLTGRLPFESESGMEVLIQHIREAPPRPREILPTIPGPLEEVALRCLAKDPAHRFQSGEELSSALEGVVAGLRETRSFGAQPAANGGAPSEEDPRYRVPSDRTLGLLSPTESDLGGEAPPLLEEATEQVRPAPPPAPVGATTVGLARDINVGRRRFVLHGLLTAGSILFGSAVGATTYWVREGSSEPALEPSPKPAPEPPATPVSAPTPNAPLPQPEGATPPSKTTLPTKTGRPRRSPTAAGKRPTKPKAKTRPKARTKTKAAAKPKAAPRPLGRVSTDHHSEEPPGPAPTPKPEPAPKAAPRPATPKPKPPSKRPTRNDDFYDLVD
jgi:serine/threonine protein kinase